MGPRDRALGWAEGRGPRDWALGGRETLALSRGPVSLALSPAPSPGPISFAPSPGPLPRPSFLGPTPLVSYGVEIPIAAQENFVVDERWRRVEPVVQRVLR